MSVGSGLMVGLLVIAGSYSDVVVRRTCLPNDAPAIGLYFWTAHEARERSQRPHLRVAIARAVITRPISAPTTIALDIANQRANVSRCPAGKPCQSAVAGTVVFDRLDEGRGASGRFELRFRDGDVERGSFEARWSESREICG